MSVYVRNLTINTHADFTENLELYQTGGKITNLTGFTGYSQMRKNPESSTYVDINVGFTSAVDGKIQLSLGSTVTSTLKPGRYVYDLLLIRPNTERTIALEGQVLVRAGVTTGCP